MPLKHVRNKLNKRKHTLGKTQKIKEINFEKQKTYTNN